MENYYGLLNIHPTASAAEIQRALLRAAEQQTLPIEILQTVKDNLLNQQNRADYDKQLKAARPDLFLPPQIDNTIKTKSLYIEQPSEKEPFEWRGWHIAVMGLVCFSLGWGSGRAYLRHEVNSKIQEGLSGIRAATKTPQNKAPAAQSENTKKESQSPAEAAELPITEWKYGESKDEMRGTITQSAVIGSENTINLDFPYGEVMAGIGLYRHPGKSIHAVGLLITGGQLSCRDSAASYKGCEISIKFDNQIERFNVAKHDELSNIAYVTAPDDIERFRRQLKTSAKVIVELPIYQHNKQQFVFGQTRTLKW